MSSKKSHTRGINPSLLKSSALKQEVDTNDQQLLDDLLSGNIRALSQAITLVESTNHQHYDRAQHLIEQCLPHSTKSIRIGITGIPGVGKSTFIEAFGMHLIEQGKKVAVLAIDPTSTLSQGSILGDKTRMETLSVHPQAYIRPSASGDSLGGVARKTREALILCEAAGFDTIIIETVGVGQSETMVHSMVDFFLLLKLAGAGDELQGIKRGIIEMADAIVINKADGDNIKAARMAVNAFAKALHLYPPKDSAWTPKVSSCSALEKEGVAGIWTMIKAYETLVLGNTHFTEKRIAQNSFWLRQTIENQLKDGFYNHPEVQKRLPQFLEAIAQNTMSPFKAAQELLRIKSTD